MLSDTQKNPIQFEVAFNTYAMIQLDVLSLKVSRCFWAMGQHRQLVTWQLVCHSAQECAGHCMVLTVHLSHLHHDWSDCGVSWRKAFVSLPREQTGPSSSPAKCRVGSLNLSGFFFLPSNTVHDAALSSVTAMLFNLADNYQLSIIFLDSIPPFSWN